MGKPALPAKTPPSAGACTPPPENPKSKATGGHSCRPLPSFPPDAMTSLETQSLGPPGTPPQTSLPVFPSVKIVSHLYSAYHNKLSVCMVARPRTSHARQPQRSPLRASLFLIKLSSSKRKPPCLTYR
jgi:hypothetical protein